MNFPTSDEIEAADRVQLARWFRFLPSPGANYINSTDFEARLESERVLLDRILERFTELGGMSSSISKHIGWEQ